MAPNIPDLAEKAITNIEYGRLGAVTTLCVIQMDNGHEVVGQSHCANPASFDEEIGRVEALKIAMGKVEELIAFRLKEESPTNQPEEIPPGSSPLYRGRDGRLARIGTIVESVVNPMQKGVSLRLEDGSEIMVSDKELARVPSYGLGGMSVLLRVNGDSRLLFPPKLRDYTPVNEEELRSQMQVAG